MDNGPSLGFFMIVVGIPVIMGVGSKMYYNYLKHKERALELQAKAGQGADRESIARIEKLEARVRVLERLATDKGRSLADEIDSLRDDDRSAY